MGSARRTTGSLPQRALGTYCLASALVSTTLVGMVNGAWIDVDTPEDKRTTKSYVDGSTYHLVSLDVLSCPKNNQNLAKYTRILLTLRRRQDLIFVGYVII
jgi:hypothetical protein